jgi:hypothetical protein
MPINTFTKEVEIGTTSSGIPPVFSVVRVTQSLALCVCFVDCCLSFCTFSLGHCVVCSSSIYGFWLPLWYLQTLLMIHFMEYISNFSSHDILGEFCFVGSYVNYFF